jgi:hypothetical protein
MQIHDYYEFIESDHPVLPPASRRNLSDSARQPTIQGMPWVVGHHETGEFSNVTNRENATLLTVDPVEELLQGHIHYDPPARLHVGLPERRSVLQDRRSAEND